MFLNPKSRGKETPTINYGHTVYVHLFKCERKILNVECMFLNMFTLIKPWCIRHYSFYLFTIFVRCPEDLSSVPLACGRSCLDSNSPGSRGQRIDNNTSDNASTLLDLSPKSLILTVILLAQHFVHYGIEVAVLLRCHQSKKQAEMETCIISCSLALSMFKFAVTCSAKYETQNEKKKFLLFT